MALHWDSTKTALDSENDYDMSLRDAAIWATMGTGINKITRENALDFYKRVNFVERVSGTFRFKAGEDGKAEPLFFSAEDVVKCIGLSTNASPKTQAQFNKSIWESHERWHFSYGFKMPLDSAGTD